ncbi:MAG: reprolysin-like metallopeptidase [Bacteroidia bacterium]
MLSQLLQAQSFIWSKSTPPSGIPEEHRWIKPEKFGLFKLNLSEMRALLDQSPEEFSSGNHAVLVEIPMPDHTFQRFAVYHSSVMEPGLAKKFPEIDTWRGQGIDNPRASVHIDITLQGFHAMILSPEGSVFVDPYAKSTTEYYISYFKKDLKAKAKFNEIEVVNANKSNPVTPVKNKTNLNKSGASLAQRSNGTQLKTYRLALAATFEYTTFHGGTVALALSAMTTTVNRVVGVYRTEFGINLTLVSNTNLLIYTTASDPYTNTNGSTMLSENQTNITNIIGSANYDIGHVFSTGGGGVAFLASVCVTSNKARGVTGSASPVNDAFDIDYVAHEMGHQFGGNHTFNGSTGSCSGGNRNASTAYEPGSGSTIMAYAGICSPQDLQSNSDPYFHTINFDEIVTNITTGAALCGVVTSSGNNLPVASIGTTAHTIPFGTPFFLTGSGTDPDGDSLSYCWEQMNLGAASAPNTPPNPGPRFRSYNPSISPTRFIPNYTALLNNVVPIGEILSTAAQTLNFRLTVRDGRALCGGVDYDVNSKVITIANTGPFAVTSAPSVWAVGSSQTVTWSLGGSNTAPINVANVKISLSTDGGLTFPYILENSTPNDGTQLIQLPASITTQSARIKIEAIGNIFFAISPNNFAIDDPSAGSFITIGTGTGSNTSTAFPAPYGNYFGGVKHQFIYRASELTARGVTAGMLTQFGFNVSSLVSGNLNDFSIGMKNSTVNDLTSAWQTGFTTVFSTPVYNANIGWNLHTLNPGFYWDGTSNIIVEVCFNNNNGGTTGNTLTALTTGLPTGTSRWFRADNTPTLCSSTSVTTAGNTSRPNARMFVITAPTISASALNFSNITNTSVTLSWTKGNGGRRIVIARLSSTPAIAPMHLTDYLSAPFFGMGQQTGNNNFCVYNDSGNTATVTGLNLATNYTFDVYEYNGTNGNHVYRLISPLSGSITTLPVKLIRFNATKEESKIVLNWTSASEINSDVFEIEKLDNATGFKQIGKVQAAGFSNRNRNYTFNDYSILNESELFYRLKMVDKDGSFEYSPIASVLVDELNTELSVSPNPNKGLMWVQWENQNEFTFELLDIHGVTIMKGQSDKSSVELDVPSQYKGLFVLICKSGEQHITKKILIQ